MCIDLLIKTYVYIILYSEMCTNCIMMNSYPVLLCLCVCQCLKFEKFITTLLCVLAYLNVYSSIYMYTACMSILISLVSSPFLAWLPLLAVFKYRNLLCSY